MENPEIVVEKSKVAQWWENNSTSVGNTVGFLITRAVFAGIIMGLTILTYQQFFAQRIITVDVRKLVADEIAQADKRGDTDQKRAVLADRFNTALEAELNTLNNGRNIVLVTPAVVRGGEDQTSVMQGRIRARMEAKQ